MDTGVFRIRNNLYGFSLQKKFVTALFSFLITRFFWPGTATKRPE
jgi:hypothetical protein